jgi:hypothetical protein
MRKWRKGQKKLCPIPTVTCMASLFVLIFATINGFFIFKFRSSIHKTKFRNNVEKSLNPKGKLKNLVYIKMIKCASETLSSMFYRFAYDHDLSVVLPQEDKLYLGWPYQLEPEYYRPVLNGGFNILCDHMVYNATKLEALMPRETIYITSIREPFSQVQSMFHYYNLAEIVGLNKENGNNVGLLKQYFRDIVKYEAAYQSPKVKNIRYCVPDGFSMTRNLMSFTLGFPTGWRGKDLSRNKDAIDRFINLISMKFSLVMVIEYFIESLILLRRTLSWGWKDIMYVAKNKGTYAKNDPSTVDPELMQTYREYSSVDVALYTHFNSTLWQKIKSEGTDFYGEVAAFQQALSKAVNFCGTKSKGTMALNIIKSRWDEGFEISLDDCKILEMSYLDIMKLYKSLNTTKQKQAPGASSHRHSSNTFC